MTKLSIHRVIKTSIVTALTLTAALIWKDAIMDLIDYIVPPKEAIFYEFLTAIIATVIVVVALYIVLKTDEETEYVIKKIKKKSKGK